MLVIKIMMILPGTVIVSPNATGGRLIEFCPELIAVMLLLGTKLVSVVLKTKGYSITTVSLPTHWYSLVH